ncbi:MAG: hypothetical protein JOZ10_16700 [Acidobacteria bacterium]|nr:hypothetical protein [Acidobacteriota bacterium]MBV9144974.1 hypothetical protein [Acidobacteriota bacterium]
MEPIAILAVVAIVALAVLRPGVRQGKEAIDMRRRTSAGALISGLVIATVGVVLLLDRLGVASADYLFRFWPMIFVAVGIVKLIEACHASDQVWGGFLISMGCLLTLHEFGYIHFGIGQLWPVFLIAAGLGLAWHSNEVREGRAGFSIPGNFTPSPNANPNALHMIAVFGGIERKVEGTFFDGSNVTAFFGGFKIDLSRAEMDGNEAVMYVNAVFGGGEIIAPESWRVSVEGAGIFGGYVDKTRYVPRQDAQTKLLHVRGAAIFGGIEVKSW